MQSIVFILHKGKSDFARFGWVAIKNYLFFHVRLAPCKEASSRPTFFSKIYGTSEHDLIIDLVPPRKKEGRLVRQSRSANVYVFLPCQDFTCPHGLSAYLAFRLFRFFFFGASRSNAYCALEEECFPWSTLMALTARREFG